jgi:hypothetical protein
MEARETPLMLKYGESKKTRIMVVTVRHVTSGAESMKFFFAQSVYETFCNF